MPIPIGLIAAGVGGLFKIGSGNKQRRMANAIKVPEANYTENTYAKQILGEAQRMKNSQMPGYNQAAANIMANEANVIGSAQRNASNSNQALAMAAAAQAQGDSSFGNLAQLQGQHQMNMLQNYNAANQGMVAEGDKLHADNVRKQMIAIQQKNALMGAAGQNTGGGINDIINAFLSSGITIGKKK